LLAAYHILTDHLPYDQRLHLPTRPRPPSPWHLVQQQIRDAIASNLETLRRCTTGDNRPQSAGD
jgi:hypothetical protein